MNAWAHELREAEGLKSVTVRLNEGQYALLQAEAVARDISPTALAKELIVGRMVVVEAEEVFVPREGCVREAQHRPGVFCLLCGYG